MIAATRNDCRAEPRLSPRQEECLRGILELKSAKEIAHDLGISPHAVEKHLRVSREKFGASTSAEAARLFASQRQGSDFPQGGFSDLVARRLGPQQGPVFEPAGKPSSARLEDAHGAFSTDQQLSPRQTLLAIVAISLGSIIGLLVLVACAQAVRSLVSG